MTCLISGILIVTMMVCLIMWKVNPRVVISLQQETMMIKMDWTTLMKEVETKV